MVFKTSKEQITNLSSIKFNVQNYEVAQPSTVNWKNQQMHCWALVQHLFFLSIPTVHVTPWTTHS